MPLCNHGESLVLLASATAMALAKDLTDEEIELLSDFLMAVSDNLALLAAKPVTKPEGSKQRDTLPKEEEGERPPL